jgi:two-component system chemotaxis sensor kinase CheA
MLVFSYAANEYFAIPLELVAIIERITPNDLRMIGQKEYCQLKQETISVMRLDNFLPINEFDPTSNDCCLVRAAAVSYPIGILTGPDVSIIEVDDTFETRLNDSKGILGTFLHQDRLIMLLDIYSVFEQHAPDKMALTPIKTSRARILIAEDSLFFRRLICQYVKCDDWDVEIFNDGLEAWEMLQQEPTRYQLIISDINMPRMDGFEFATNVRDDRRFDNIPMVALTTLSDEHFREKGLSLGFDRYVIKIDKHQIRQTVAECLNIKRQVTKR